MGRLQRELLQTARELIAEDLMHHEAFAPRWPRIAIVLSGSAATEYADEFSSVDLIVLGDEPELEALERDLGPVDEADESTDEGWIEVPFDARRVKVSFMTFAEAARRLAAYDDFAMAVFPAAPILHDPEGRFAQLVAGVGEIPEAVLAHKIARRYAKLRRRQASLAWNLRRGQPYALLDNLNRLLAHLLAICFYLDGRPPTGRKWIFQGALRTEAGRRLRPHLFELFSSLGDLATLGGSLHIRQNRLYRLVARLHDELVAIAREAGHDLQRDAREGVRDGERGP